MRHAPFILQLALCALVIFLLGRIAIGVWETAAQPPVDPSTIEAARW